MLKEIAEIIETYGGKVGRYESENYTGKKIGIQFKDKEKNLSPIYILDPWAAGKIGVAYIIAACFVGAGWLIPHKYIYVNNK